MDDEGKLLLIRGRRQKLTMASVGAAFLVVGVLVAPADDASKPTNTVPEEPVAPLFSATPTDSLSGFQGWLDAGVRALPRTVSVVAEAATPVARSRRDLQAPDPPPREAPGVLVRPGRILTHRDLLAGDVFQGSLAAVTTEGRHPVRVERCDPASGLMLLAVEGLEAREPAALASTPSRDGTPAIAASLLGARPVLLPVLLTGLQRGGFRVGLSTPPAGTPLFDREGRLLGLSGPHGSGWTAEAALSRLDGLNPPVPLSLGLTLQAITEDLQPLVEPPGVLVAAADPSATGIAAGDVVVRVGETDIATEADYDRALAAVQADTAVTMTLRRGRETVSHDVLPRPICGVPAAGGPAAASTLADSLFTTEALQAAGLPATAGLLEVDGVDPSKWRPRRRAPALVRALVPGRPPAFYVVRP